MLTPLGARVGNFLYFWLQAHRAQAAGRELRVRVNDNLENWVDVWPGVARFLIERHDIGRTDRLLPVPLLHHQEFGVDFTRDELNSFIRECLFSESIVSRMVAPDERVLTVNVRRGDYYSVPEYRAAFAMDVEGFVRKAVEVSLAAGSVRSVLVVSDDPEWCGSHLRFLDDVAPVLMAGGGALDNLAALASASRLVLANSTFSYWGAYLAGAKPESAHVVAPRFHMRGVNDGAAWQHDPSWQIVPV